MNHPSRVLQATPIIPHTLREFCTVLNFIIRDIRIFSVMSYFRDLHSAAKVGLLTEFNNIVICYCKLNGYFFLPRDTNNILKPLTDVRIMPMNAFGTTEQVAHSNIVLFYYYLIKIGNCYVYDENRERLRKRVTRFDINRTGAQVLSWIKCPLLNE